MKAVHDIDYEKQSREIVRPLLPGYVFVAFDPAAYAWGEIDRVYGVSHIFCDAAGKLIRVPDVIMAEVFAMTDPDGVKRPPQVLVQDYSADLGKRFVLTHGPLASFSGECERSNSNELRIVVDFLGTLLPADVPRHWAEREDAA
jgi:transcriptional antiterminator RfaH